MMAARSDLRPDDLATLATITAHVTSLRVREPTEDRSDVVTLVRLVQEDGGYLWAVQCRGNALSKSGRWEYESSPSNRRKDHARRFRWTSLADAWKAAVKAQGVADREWAEHVARCKARWAAEEAARG